MTRTDYLRLRRIHRATRDPELGRMLLAYERERRPRSPAEVVQLSIRVLEVYCDPCAARITLTECIRRQEARTPTGRGKGFPLYAESCARCSLGKIHKAMSPGFTPAPYRVNPGRLSRQRVALAAAAKRGAFDRIPTIDSPSGEE